MPPTFDAYHRWLGISPKDQPPHHYRLLGIDLFESDPEVIRDAAEQRIAHVRRYQLGPNAALSQQILNELAGAKACLLDQERKAAYDAQLYQQMADRGLNATAAGAEPAALVPPPGSVPLESPPREADQGPLEFPLIAPRPVRRPSPRRVGGLLWLVPLVLSGSIAAWFALAETAPLGEAPSKPKLKTPQPAQPDVKNQDGPAAEARKPQPQEPKLPPPASPQPHPSAEASPAPSPFTAEIHEGRGCGRVQIGMSREALIALLGPPEAGSTDQFLTWAKKFHFHCFFRHARGVGELRFNPGFPGKLASGIGFGSSEADVRRSYGEPNSTRTSNGCQGLDYTQKGVLIFLRDDHVCQIIVTEVSGKSR